MDLQLFLDSSKGLWSKGYQDVTYLYECDSALSRLKMFSLVLDRRSGTDDQGMRDIIMQGHGRIPPLSMLADDLSVRI